LKPDPGRAQHLFSKVDLGPKAKFTEWVKICATPGYWWRSKSKYDYIIYN